MLFTSKSENVSVNIAEQIVFSTFLYERADEDAYEEVSSLCFGTEVVSTHE